MDNLARQNIAKELLANDKIAEIQAVGFSMFPSFWPRFVHYVCKCDPATLKRGNVIVFQRSDNKWIAHRVVSNSDGTIITRGDSVPRNDNPICYDQVVGEVIRTKVLGIRFGIKWWLPTFYGRMLLACHPVSTYVNHAEAWCVCKLWNLIKRLKSK